ncbi:MAG: hypothetical protein M3174_07540 [Actinomycetota bacterium]|nr:hypothetical protein [Actinomycetota bacterium]
MATTERVQADRFTPLMEELARTISRHGIDSGDGSASKGLLRIENEFSVRRVLQAYWTPFQADIPGRSIGLHLEVSEPRVHWAEGYITPDSVNWVFTFRERPDGEIELAYYEQYQDPFDAIKGFFNLSSWYVLTACDLKWSDVNYKLSDELQWPEHLQTLAEAETGKAVQEALKKSTILWLRYDLDGRQITMPVWFLYDSKANRIYVLSGERQQTVPGAERIRQADVILRWKGRNAQVAEIPADIRVLEHGPNWDDVAEKIAEKRLNIPGLPEETARRWRDECVILEVVLQQ